MKKFFFLPVFCLFFLRPLCSGADENIEAKVVNETDRAGVKERLLSSLMFRGELADSLLDAGLASGLVDLDGIETHAGARAALLTWIRANPDKAADLYLRLKNKLPVLATGERTSVMRWEYNPKFMELVRALNAAAKNSAVSPETLELAARRLYGGEQAGAESPAVAARAAGGADFFSIKYADYRLNAAGLKREISGAGAWLAAAGGPAGRGPEGLEDLYGSAVEQYGSFVAAASSVQGRKLITAAESRGLETLRAGLRRRLAALSFGARAAGLADMAASLRGLGGQPGQETLLADVLRLKSGFKAEAGRARAQETALDKTAAAVGKGEDDFAAMCLRYSAYMGLFSLKRASADGGFSCLYDYAIYRYLAACFPGSAYPAARAALASAAGELDQALKELGTGTAGAGMFSLGPLAGRVGAALRLTRGASAYNRGAQFFLWGFVFRPFEYRVSVDKGRPVFRPAFTLMEIIRAGRP